MKNQEALELLISEEEGSLHFSTWCVWRQDRCHHRVPTSAPAIVMAEQFVQKVEGMILNAELPPSENYLQEMGKGLFETLFSGQSKNLYVRLPKNRNVPLAIVSKDARVLNLPWEYLHDSTQPAGPILRRPLVRVIPTQGDGTSESEQQPRPVRILFIACEPKGVTAVGREEQTQLLENLAAASGGAVHLEQVAKRFTTKKDILEKLGSAPAFEVVHCLGHGEDGRFLLSEADGTKAPIGANDFALLMQSRGIKVVVLSACRSGSGAFAREFAVVATALVQAGIPAVLAMQYSIRPEVATVVVSRWYKYLLDGLDLDEALAHCRRDIAIQYGTTGVEWGIAVLYRQLGARSPLGLKAR